MLRGLRRRGVPVRNRTELLRVEARGEALAATFAHADGTETTVTVDALLMNGGFEPQNEVLRLLGAAMRYDPDAGHLRTVRSETLETTVPGLWAVGDCAGLGGAPAARAEGRIAGARRRRGRDMAMPTTSSPTSASCATTGASSGGSGGSTTSRRRACWTCPTTR
jgi:pyruvate/2-oxoglutarate dehydrogenase complex dihydrolipoamide dehydrogenase (E3) component